MLCWLNVGLLLATTGGCSRPFWRTQADFDTYNLLMEKSADDRWDVPRLTLEPDPRSRIYDPYDPDLEPLPPDDESAHVYMHWVDGMQGYKSWHRFGEAMNVENPQWMAQFETAPRDYGIDWLEGDRDPDERTSCLVPTIRNMTLEQAVELANIHSREYQLTLENTYQAALALSFARFQFNVRYLGFGRQQPTSTLNYINQPSTLDTLSYNNRFGVSQLLPTGGQWVAEVANNTLWLFSTPGRTNSASLLSYSLVQPLLAGAGRKVVLENLTFNERNVLYNLRTLTRFRRLFFANVVSNPGAYLALNQQMQVVENLRSNLREFRIQIERLQEINRNPPKFSEEDLAALPEGLEIPEEFAERLSYDAERAKLIWIGELDLETEERLIALSGDPAYQRAVRAMGATYRLEVYTQEVSQILNQAAGVQINLRQAENTLQNTIDNFKLTLGLPTDFQITLDRSMLDPFELIDPDLRRLEDLIQDVIKHWNPDGAELTEKQLLAISDQLESIRRLIDRRGFDMVAGDLVREAENRPERLRRLSDELAREQVLRNVERDRILFQRNQDQNLRLGRVLLEMQTLLKQTRLPQQEPAQDEAGVPLNPEDFPEISDYLHWSELPTRRGFLGGLRSIREDLLQIVQGLKVVQVGARSELISLREFDMELEDAVAIAVENRLDLMNQRAAVMDARRNLEVVANSLQGVLNVVTRGDIRNTGGTDPFDFRADESTFQFGLQFTAPLDQVQVRNNYRNALINYQQARRAYMQAEDEIKQDIRAEWRLIQLNKANFETARQNIRYAAINYDVTVENTYQPSQLAVSAVPNVGGGLRSAPVNGLNLINALQGILNAQNSLIGIWVQYEQNRVNIYRDMDIMEVDDRGLWSDPAYLPELKRAPALPSEPADVDPPDSAAAGADRAPPARAAQRSRSRLVAAEALEEEDSAVGPRRSDADRRARLAGRAGRAALAD